MLLSMTGYGRAKGEFQGKSYTIEIRTLNGKTTDIRVKLPPILKVKEIELRKFILDDVFRGKVDLTIQVSAGETDTDLGLNMKLFEKYFKQLYDFGQKHGLHNQDFVQAIIRIPNVVEAIDEELSEDEWAFVLSQTENALAQLRSFRTDEGGALKNDLLGRLERIQQLLIEVEPHEATRKEELVSRLEKLIADNLSHDNIDENRLEQETIYYLEKLDIHEEKIRLQQHCVYFLSEINSEKIGQGKKLNFISQEMGREINTLGAKAQYSPIQQIVVEMKVELDQIKEQLANVL